MYAGQTRPLKLPPVFAHFDAIKKHLLSGQHSENELLRRLFFLLRFINLSVPKHHRPPGRVYRSSVRVPFVWQRKRRTQTALMKILNRYHFPVKRSMSHRGRSLRYFLFPQWILRAILIGLDRGCDKRTRAKLPLRAEVWGCRRRGNLDTGDAISSRCWLRHVIKYLQRQTHFLEAPRNSCGRVALPVSHVSTV